MRQIHCAIEHLKEGHYEAAITLAAAAEGMLPETEARHLRQPVNLTVSQFLYVCSELDWRDAARAARQHCHESSAQSSPNSRDRIWNVPFRPQWRSPAGDKLREA